MAEVTQMAAWLSEALDALQGRPLECCGGRWLWEPSEGNAEQGWLGQQHTLECPRYGVTAREL